MRRQCNELAFHIIRLLPMDSLHKGPIIQQLIRANTKGWIGGIQSVMRVLNSSPWCWLRYQFIMYHVVKGRTGLSWTLYWGFCFHDDVIKWKHFPRYWPFVRGIPRSQVNSPHKGQWRGALMFSLIYACLNGWVNIGEAGDLRRHRAHYDVTVMCLHSGLVYVWLSKVSFKQKTFQTHIIIYNA